MIHRYRGEARDNGAGGLEGIVGADLDASGRAIRLWIRSGGRVSDRVEPFVPFCWVESPGTLEGCPAAARVSGLAGGQPLRALAEFESWPDFERALGWLRRRGGGGADAPYFAVSDPVQQHFLRGGGAFFRGLAFGDLVRLQLDIETRTTEGYDFPNPEREGDRILAIGLSDTTGWERLISARDGTEREMIEEAARGIRERDPDVVEGHNLFSFDLPFLRERARRHGIGFPVGRDGSDPAVRPGRFTAAERSISYPRAEIAGRSVVDTYFLAQLYDVSHRSLPGFGLKEVARHFGLTREGRVRVDAGRMDREFAENPDRVLAYLRDDLAETRGLSDLFAPVFFEQARRLPFGFQSVCLRGAAAKIDALLLRDVLRLGRSVPRPDAPRPFSGGLTEVFFQGVARGVHHCDARSLYPSLMLAERIGPASDETGVFLEQLGRLRELRLRAKDEARRAGGGERARGLDALQGSFKILINSFYGYLGFEQARFSDFEAAARVAARGREILSGMIDWIRGHGGVPIEMDTDGIYYTPPPGETPEARRAFRDGLAASLPAGIEVEFDDEYPAMFSYKAKNYALLREDGEVVLKGAALKSRGLEPFQRRFIREAVERHLRGEPDRIAELAESYREAIRERRWPVREFARSERLTDSPEAYARKQAGGARARGAAFELALRSGRPYRAGDTIRYYVAGDKASAPVHENARLLSEWDPLHRDENVAYYLAKLNALARKFGPTQTAERRDQREFGW